MKEHWILAEQPLLKSSYSTYTWSPPWPAILVGVRASARVELEDVEISGRTVASMFTSVGFPELEQLPRGLVYEWKAEKRHEILVGGRIEFVLGRMSDEPGDHKLELRIEPRELVFRREAEAQAARARKRERQLRECLPGATLSAKRYPDEPPLAWTKGIIK